MIFNKFSQIEIGFQLTFNNNHIYLEFYLAICELSKISLKLYQKKISKKL